MYYREYCVDFYVVFHYELCEPQYSKVIRNLETIHIKISLLYLLGTKVLFNDVYHRFVIVGGEERVLSNVLKKTRLYYSGKKRHIVESRIVVDTLSNLSLLRLWSPI